MRCVVALLMFLTRRVDWYGARFASARTYMEGADDGIPRILMDGESFSGDSE